MWKAVATVGLLVVSNAFMTLAWYGHIAFKSKLERFGLVAIVLISWGIALFEYCFQVPANRIGSAQFGGPFTLWQLKVIQEVVSLSVFTVFALVFMKSDTLRWNHLAGFICLIMAVYFIFRKSLPRGNRRQPTPPQQLPASSAACHKAAPGKQPPAATRRPKSRRPQHRSAFPIPGRRSFLYPSLKERKNGRGAGTADAERSPEAQGGASGAEFSSDKTARWSRDSPFRSIVFARMYTFG